MAVVWMHFVRKILTSSSKTSFSFSRKNSLNSVIKISKEKSSGKKLRRLLVSASTTANSILLRLPLHLKQMFPTFVRASQVIGITSVLNILVATSFFK